MSVWISVKMNWNWKFPIFFNLLLHTQKQIDDATKCDAESDQLKRSAFNQYFSISQDMITYEKELFDRFLSEGTFVVNNVLKRNILKLRYISMPDDFKDDIKSRKEPSPPANLTRMQKNSRTQSRSKSSSVMGMITPRRNMPHKSKFNVLSTAIQWMTSRHDTDNPDLALAEKLVRASASSTSLRSIGSKAHHRDTKAEFKITQAKCKFSVRLKSHFLCFSLKLESKSNELEKQFLCFLPRFFS